MCWECDMKQNKKWKGEKIPVATACIQFVGHLLCVNLWIWLRSILFVEFTNKKMQKKMILVGFRTVNIVSKLQINEACTHSTLKL